MCAILPLVDSSNRSSFSGSVAVVTAVGVVKEQQHDGCEHGQIVTLRWG